MVKSAKAGLAFLDRASKGSGKLSKKLKKAKEAKAKSTEAKAKSKEAVGATKVPKDPMKANTCSPRSKSLSLNIE